MRVENFFSCERDQELSVWLDEFLGREIFSPNESRLEKFFSSFKKDFKEKKIPIITVGGTNGKGEVSLFLEEIFLQKGLKPYLWSSPHIITVRERFSLRGSPVSGDRLLKLFYRFQKEAQELSYYEFLFYLFCYLVKEDTDKESSGAVIIFEVGLGGRLDATNYFDAEVTAITSIGRDHMDLLGPTLKHVLKEKLGITRRNRPLVASLDRKYLVDLCRDHCEEEGIPLYLMEFQDSLSFQDKNWLMAKKLAHLFFKSSDEDYQRPQTLWARPFEVTYEGQQFTLLGSHNLDGLRSLAHWANEKKTAEGFFFDETWLGMSRKDNEEISHCLELIDQSFCLSLEIRFFEFDHPRATSLHQLKDCWEKEDRKKKAYFETDFRNLSFKGNKNILVCGSYYFLGFLLGHRNFSRGLYSPHPNGS